MRQYILDRHTVPGSNELYRVTTPKIPVYDDLDAAEADLNNLHLGQLVATKDTGDPYKEEVIWENPNPTSSFSTTTLTSQTLGKDLSKYYAIYVYVKNVSVGGLYSVCKCYKGLYTTLTAPAGKWVHTRGCTLTDSQIEIEDGYATSTADGTSTVNNLVAIPIKIWGKRR